MRSDFIQGAYNPYEHDYVERSDEQLQERLFNLAKSREYAQSGERRRQIEREMGLIALELSERFRELKNEEIEEAWGERELYGNVEA